MWKEQRHLEIIDLLNKESNYTIRSLSEKFNLSEITIRKDIKELSDKGLIARRYGSFSAISSDPKDSNYDSLSQRYSKFVGTPVDNRKQEENAIKDQLAESAFPKILQVTNIFIDDSSTVMHLLPFFKNVSGITIITPSIEAILYLSNIPNVHTIGLGGTVCSIHKSFIGPIPIEQLSHLSIDLAIFGCYGAREEGTLENFHSIVGLKQQAVRQSKESIIMMSGSKWSQNEGVPSIAWENISTIFTSSLPPKKIQDTISKYKTKIIIV